MKGMLRLLACTLLVTAATAVPAGELKFIRWEVEFNLDKNGAGLTVDTVPVALDFLRTPFSF